MDSKRNCTLPNIPYFRDWFEEQFGDLCQAHDKEYGEGDCKLCADKNFVIFIRARGYKTTSILTFIALQMPWVWWKWRNLRQERL